MFGFSPAEISQVESILAGASATTFLALAVWGVFRRWWVPYFFLLEKTQAEEKAIAVAEAAVLAAERSAEQADRALEVAEKMADRTDRLVDKLDRLVDELGRKRP